MYIIDKNGKVMGNTEYIVSIIQKDTGADLFKIQTVQ